MGTCASLADDLAALALNALTGRRRGEVLSHVAGCQHCTEELAELTRASDFLLALAPNADAPLGFESRLAERLRPVTHRPARALWRRPILASLMSVLLLLSALLAGTVIGAHRSPAPVTATRSVNLMSDRLSGSPAVVGKVLLLGGTPTWMLMTLEYGGWSGDLSCQVVLRSGQVETLGTFRVTTGYDSWTIPIRAPISDVIAARLVRADGVLLASATLNR